ncbi:hypothetical protein K9L16_03040 [Candidatus Pacearchaeota archaeon]|nr:hypothetical protein [Candidatus Pacearchaeota archaeon]
MVFLREEIEEEGIEKSCKDYQEYEIKSNKNPFELGTSEHDKIEQELKESLWEEHCNNGCKLKERCENYRILKFTFNTPYYFKNIGQFTHPA